MVAVMIRPFLPGWISNFHFDRGTKNGIPLKMGHWSIQFHDFFIVRIILKPKVPWQPPPLSEETLPLETVEARHIQRVLDACQGGQSFRGGKNAGD